MRIESDMVEEIGRDGKKRWVNAKRDAGAMEYLERARNSRLSQENCEVDCVSAQNENAPAPDIATACIADSAAHQTITNGFGIVIDPATGKPTSSEELRMRVEREREAQIMRQAMEAANDPINGGVMHDYMEAYNTPRGFFSGSID